MIKQKNGATFINRGMGVNCRFTNGLNGPTAGELFSNGICTIDRAG